MIGGQVLAGTPAPQGASWFSSTQLSAASAPTMNSTAPVLMLTRLAPGAAPCIFVPSDEGDVATGDDPVDVRAVPADRTAGRCPSEPASTGAQVLSVERVAHHLEVLDHGGGAVGVLQERVGGVDAGVDDGDRDALAVEAVPSAPVRVLRASSPRVALLEVDRSISIGLVALDVGHARLGPDQLHLGGQTRSRRPRRSCRTWSPGAGRRPATASLAAARSVPCTRTVVGVAASSTPSWRGQPGLDRRERARRRAAGRPRRGGEGHGGEGGRGAAATTARVLFTVCMEFPSVA